MVEKCSPPHCIEKPLKPPMAKLEDTKCGTARSEHRRACAHNIKKGNKLSFQARNPGLSPS
eukprot:1356805-Amphidinium_carterae.1